MDTGLLVDGVHESRSRLGSLLRKQHAGDIKLEALCELVLELELSAESVGSGPSLSGNDTLLEVRVLGLNVGVDLRSA